MPRTTRPVRAVRTIEDIAAIEARSYDELVPARNLYDLVLATARAVGERPALTVLLPSQTEAVGLALTHAALLAAVTQAANLFRALGVRPGAGGVVFLSPTCPELPAALLGAQVAGVASTLNYLLSREAIVDLLTAAGASVLVIPDRRLDEGCWAKAQGLCDDVPTLEHVLIFGAAENSDSRTLSFAKALGAARSEGLDFQPTTDRSVVCALFHTGGTTGRPKLVQLTHGNQIHAAFGFAQVFGYDEHDTVINGFPFFHVGGTMTTGLSVLAAGGHVVVPSPYALRPPTVIEGYWRMAERHRATVVSGVPTSIAALANAWTPGIDVSAVRMAVTGGAVLPKAIASRFEAVTGIRLFETYGMTETAAAIAFNPGRGERVPGSVGFRAPYAQTRIVSLDAAVPCAANESGLVQVRGPQVFPGYLDPRHNLGTLAPDGWLTTGDVGYLTAEQRLVLTGREKDLIVRSGHNIDPAAIEDVANQFEGVQISAAVGMPDQYAGEVPALFVVPRPGAAIDLALLRRFVETKVHEAPARPKSILIIEALPVTAVGKIFKPALRDLAIQEKVRLEVERVCGAQAAARVEVRQDRQKNTLVTVTVAKAAQEALTALAEALRPLPQSYVIQTEGA